MDVVAKLLGDEERATGSHREPVVPTLKCTTICRSVAKAFQIFEFQTAVEMVVQKLSGQGSRRERSGERRDWYRAIQHTSELISEIWGSKLLPRKGQIEERYKKISKAVGAHEKKAHGKFTFL